MSNLSIDNNQLSILKKVSILEICEAFGTTIPRFCYHEILSVSGNRRMCLIEVDTIEKPVASCATEAKDKMDIFTNNAFVKKARENVLEMILINHPLDCPICDQAGECDLQDQSKAYGPSKTKFNEIKKTSEDKICNSFIKTVMTRCITCTRCVRFASEVAGEDFFGTVNRGNKTEISSFISKIFLSEISTNVVDLCPVGALNLESYSYHGRSWELKTTESIDITDSLGSNIFVNHKENLIFRILPKSVNEINDSIITDATRLSFEHNRTNRIAIIKENGSITTNNLIKNYLFSKNKEITFVIDEAIDLETLNCLNYLKKMKKFNVILNNKTNLTSNNFILNKKYSIKKLIDTTKDFSYLVGTNMKVESPVLNTKFRLINRTKNVLTLTSGFRFNNNITSLITSLSLSDILMFFEGIYEESLKNITRNNKGIIIFGENFFQRFLNFYLLKDIIKLILKLVKILELFRKANSEGVKMYSFKRYNNKIKNKLKVFLNTQENINLKREFSTSIKSNIWINTNMSILSNKSLFNIPSKTHFEDEFYYISLGYQIQKTQKINEIGKGIKKISTILYELFFKKKVIQKTKYITNTFYNKIESNEKTNFFYDHLYKSNLIYASLFKKYPIKQSKRNNLDLNKFNLNSATIISSIKNFNFSYSSLKKL